MPEADIEELFNTIDRLTVCVESLRARVGEPIAVLRLANNVERLRIDAVELTAGPVASAERRSVVVADVVADVVVSDAPYDPKLWHGVDDEGVGGQGFGAVAS